MLKTRAVAQALYQRRLNEKKKDTINNDAKFIILGADCQGFTPSLVVYSEGRGYIFNCNEGLQRFCHSNRTKLMHLANVFITNVDWDRLSGSYGLALTLQGLGIPSVNLNANDATEDFYKVTSSFIMLYTGMRLVNRPYSQGVYQDPGIKIEPIPLDAADVVNQDETDTKRLKRSAKLISYICELPNMRGALDPKKCNELKVPVGPLLGKLKSGEDITLSDGRIIRSADVCAPESIGIKFLVLECPTLEDIDRVLSNASLENLRSCRHSGDSKEVNFVFHFSPVDVLNDTRYKQWTEKFPEKCKHILMRSPDSQSKPNFIHSYQFQFLLNKLDNKIFPDMVLPDFAINRMKNELEDPDRAIDADSLHDEDDNKELEYERYTKLSNYSELDRYYNPCSMDQINIRPHQNVECVQSAINIDTLHRTAKYMSDFEEKLEALKSMQVCSPDPKSFEPEIVFLGTCSALPSKLRNTSFILLNFNDPLPYSVILDCGEDSYGQLYRHYGPEGAAEVLKKLKMIYVSHHHADHHIGMIKILRERSKLTRDPIAVLVPPGLEELLNYHDENFHDLSGIHRIFSTRKIRQSQSIPPDPSNTDQKDLCNFMGGLLDSIKIIPVEHCINSCAVVLKFRVDHPEMSHFTIAYSGDARPSEIFAKAGEGCDLLIHEATFDYRSQDDALLKKHCTSDEAIEVANKMKAKFTILTHFSQRLAKIPYFNEKFHSKIGFAFDNMRLRCPSGYGRLPILKDILTAIFRKNLADIDMKHTKGLDNIRLANKLINEGGATKI